MACESEINEGFGKEVLEDGLKLLDVVAPLKVLIYPSVAAEDGIADRKWRLAKLFNSHGTDEH